MNQIHVNLVRIKSFLMFYFYRLSGDYKTRNVIYVVSERVKQAQMFPRFDLDRGQVCEQVLGGRSD